MLIPKRRHSLLAPVVTLAVLLGTASHPLLGAERTRAAIQSELAAYIDALFDSEPAWGSALIAKDGRVLFEGSYGWADSSQAKPNEPRTAFRIQHLTKTFTAAAILRLVERGRLSLDDKVVDYVPELREGEAVTIRHLLQMESGIPDLIQYLEDQGGFDRFHHPEEILDYFAREPLLFEPGTQVDYSNSNYILLGLIIERTTGKSYGRFLKKKIFKPLKMRRTRYDPDDRAFANRRAIGYDDITVEPPTEALYVHPSLAYASGGVLSTARDLLKWDQALYGERVLSQETLEEAFTRGSGTCGLGWILDHVRIHGERHKLVWHAGGAPGSRGLLVRMIDARVTIILLYNTTGFEDLDLYRWVANLSMDVGEIVLRDAG
ncbi:MAG: beta-lactamase family protein [bacterium]|nr:beta-lactamase family protein [bacterium]